MSQTPKTKIAIISGAFGYVGSAVSKRLGEEGFTLVLLYNKTEPSIVESVMSSLPGVGNKAYKCDLTSYSNLEKIFFEIETEFKGVDLIVHCAGMKPERKKLSITSEASFRNQIEENVFGSFNFLKLSANLLQKQTGGVLIGITTIGVFKREAAKSLGGYIPAKYAVQGILTMLHEELAPNVRVYSIAPGFMDDGMNKQIPRAFVEMIKSKSKSKSIGSAELIASLIKDLYNKKSNLSDEFIIPLAPEYA